MLDTIILLLVAFLLMSFLAKEGLIDASAYLIGDQPEPRGSPNLTGWNLSSLYSKRPIVVDDLTQMY